jgi:hypothetical protein
MLFLHYDRDLESLTYYEDERSKRMSTVARKLGIKPGNTVVIDER